ncbi:hypothetical protein [Phascolarctobacterium succinatutens]|uniref:hypothetical protein n=1 Tax=Phascolarctobacterium succinatutens TaxID=626940 RepID=UPI00307938CD
MIDYKKAEQAKKLLAESSLDYTLAYIGEDNDAIGDVQGTVLKAADCIITIMQAVGEHVRDKYGDKAAVEMLQSITLKALGLIYSDDQEE